jgi:hypothetical protein
MMGPPQPTLHAGEGVNGTYYPVPVRYADKGQEADQIPDAKINAQGDQNPNGHHDQHVESGEYTDSASQRMKAGTVRLGTGSLGRYSKNMLV